MSINRQIINATKWSIITEVIAKLITPVVSIVLARLLTPDAFGVIATITMIISFAEIFADAGFQKYIIQHEFIDDEDKNKSINVAFWSNLVMSLLLWILITIFSDPLAKMVGNPGLGKVLIIASASIPLIAFSSIQMAIYKRELDFKTLFKVRMVSVCVPLLITIPLCFYLRNFWALIVGTIATNLANALVLAAYSKWKPCLSYSFDKLKEMFSFSSWSVVEAISIWLTGYIDVFIVGVYLNEYYLGLYKTSITVVGQIMGLITGATTPILFSSLSRVQTNKNEFYSLFFKFQKLVGLLVMPIGVGIFCYSDVITDLLMGKQWVEASTFIGLWGLSSSITIVFSHYSSEVYRAKGRPKLSVMAQFLHLAVLFPAVLISVKNGFDALIITRSAVRIELILVNFIIMYFLVGITPSEMFKNVSLSILASIIMGIVAVLIEDLSSSILWQFASIALCACVYILIVFIFPSNRKEILSLVQK